MDQCAVKCPKQLMQIYKSLLRVEASTALCLLCQTRQDHVVSYARVTLRDKNASRKILKIKVIINKLLNEKIRYNYRRKNNKRSSLRTSFDG